MLLLDYDTLLSEEIHELPIKRRKFQEYFHFIQRRYSIDLKVPESKYATDEVIARYNHVKNLLTNHYLKWKGMTQDIQENFAKFEGQDLSKLVADVNSVIKLTISIDEIIDDMDIPKTHGQLQTDIFKALLHETLDHLYAFLRLAKRATYQASIATTDDARNISRTSLRSIHSKVNGN